MASLAVSMFALWASVALAQPSGDCVDCHRDRIEEEMGMMQTHRPFRDGKCGVCHQKEMPAPADKPASVDLVMRQQDVGRTITRRLSRGTHLSLQKHRATADKIVEVSSIPGHPPVMEGREASFTACLKCHEGMDHSESNHPVDVPLDKGMAPPDDFTLAGGMIVCTSCHAPHVEANAFRLRRPGDDLCFGCHSKAVYGEK